MAVSKNGILGHIHGKVGHVSGYERYKMNIIQPSKIRGNSSNLQGVRSVKGVLDVHQRQYSDIGLFLNVNLGLGWSFPELKRYEAFTSAISRYKSAVKGVYKCDSFFDAGAQFKAVFDVRYNEALNRVEQRVQLDRSNFVGSNQVRFACCWSSGYGSQLFVDFPLVTGDFRQQNQPFGLLEQNSVFLVTLFVFQRNTAYRTNQYSFVVVS